MTPASPQIAWLEQDLATARARGPEWVILYFHVPPYSVGLYANSGERIRRMIPPLVDRYQVDLVISGHDHNYQRTHPLRDGIVRDAWQNPNFASPRGAIYMITGGGGQLLYAERPGADHRLHRAFEFAFHVVEVQVTPDFLTARAVGRDRQILDSFTIEKSRPRPELKFRRGDVDFSGDLSLVDPIVVLNYLFDAGPLECPAVASMSSNGRISVADVLYLLNYLFLAGSSPAAPFLGCGPAPNDDDAFCTRSGC